VLTGSDPGVTVRLEAGERGYGRAGATAGFTAGGARVDLAGHARRDDGFLPNDHFDGEELLARALWTTTQSTSLGLLARFNDSDTGLPTNGFQPTPSAEIGWREIELAVPVRATLSKWDLDAQLSTVQFDSAFRDPNDPFGFTAGDTESEALRGRAVATYHVSDGLWLAGGGEAERVEVDNSSNFGVSLDGSNQRTWAAFGQASWARGPFHLDLGLRHDDNDVYGSATNLRLGGVVSLGGGLRLRAGYGEAFRAPSLGELFFPGSGNPDLQPETGESLEVGLEWADGGWRLALAGFDNRQRNLIELDFATFRNFNLGRTRSRGVEAEAGYRRGIASARVNGTYLDSEDRDTGLALIRRPEHSANLLLVLTPGTWTVSAASSYVGDREDSDLSGARVTLPSYLRTDLAARWQATRRFAPYARVENATDEEYEQVLGFPAPGRRWIGGVAIEL
jgi:outer membrane cobalamin receptor